MITHTFNNFRKSGAGKPLGLGNYLRRWVRRALGLAILLCSGLSLKAADGLSLAWDANPEPDIAGYRLYYGTAPGAYTEVEDVGNTTTATLTRLNPGTTYYLAVSAYNSLDLEGPASEEIFTTYTPPVPLDADNDGLPDAWEVEYGIAELDNLTTGGAAGDADGDGISNFAEYAMHLNPSSPQGSSATPTSVEVNPADGKSYLTLTYQRLIDAPGVLFAVEVTNDLVRWSTEPDLIEQVGAPVVAVDGKSEIITVRIKPALGESDVPANIVRLRVSKLP